MAKYTFKPAFPGRLLLASTAVGALALAGPALAADIPVKAPPAVAPVPVFTWTGCYIGGHGGFATAQKYYDLTPAELVPGAVFPASEGSEQVALGFAELIDPRCRVIARACGRSSHLQASGAIAVPS